MPKEIKLFEAFAGIGAQYKALKNISKEKNWIIKTVGMIEWFIPAIVAYQLIHFGEPKVFNCEDYSNIYIYIYQAIQKNYYHPTIIKRFKTLELMII